jgi:hypothetical protein
LLRKPNTKESWMSFSYQTVTEIDGRVVEVGRRWPGRTDGLHVRADIVCTGLKPDSYEVEVCVGSFPAFSAGPYSAWEEASRAREEEPARRLAALLSDDGV